MARSRNVKPGTFTNDVLAECSVLARYLFIALWTIADREGRLEDRPKKIKAETLPYDDCDCDELLNQLREKGFILRYKAGENKYIQILNFAKHQNPHVKEQASSIPAPDMSGASNDLDSDEPGLLLIPDSLISDSIPPKSPKGEMAEFEIFWDAFPRKRRGSKEKAMVAWRKAVKKSTPQEIIDGTLEYAKSDEVARGFAKGAAAWLSDDRWKNDYSEPAKPFNSGQRPAYSDVVLDAAKLARKELGIQAQRRDGSLAPAYPGGTGIRQLSQQSGPPRCDYPSPLPAIDAQADG